MSNSTLVATLSATAKQFELSQLAFAKLRQTVADTARAIEALTDDMVTELRQIETRMEIEQSYDEEDCAAKLQETVAHLRSWLTRVPP
jgi:hypothetical protein